MTDVSLPLSARQLSKLPQQQHVPTGVTVPMGGPPAPGERSLVTLAHTAIVMESVALAWLRLPTPQHNVVEGISGIREGGRITLGEKYDNGELN